MDKTTPALIFFFILTICALTLVLLFSTQYATMPVGCGAVKINLSLAPGKLANESLGKNVYEFREPIKANLSFKLNNLSSYSLFNNTIRVILNDGVFTELYLNSSEGNYQLEFPSERVGDTKTQNVKVVGDCVLGRSTSLNETFESDYYEVWTNSEVNNGMRDIRNEEIGKSNLKLAKIAVGVGIAAIIISVFLTIYWGSVRNYLSLKIKNYHVSITSFSSSPKSQGP